MIKCNNYLSFCSKSVVWLKCNIHSWSEICLFLIFVCSFTSKDTIPNNKRPSYHSLWLAWWECQPDLWSLSSGTQELLQPGYPVAPGDYLRMLPFAIAMSDQPRRSCSSCGTRDRGVCLRFSEWQSLQFDWVHSILPLYRLPVPSATSVRCPRHAVRTCSLPYCGRPNFCHCAEAWQSRHQRFSLCSSPAESFRFLQPHRCFHRFHYQRCLLCPRPSFVPLKVSCDLQFQTQLIRFCSPLLPLWLHHYSQFIEQQLFCSSRLLCLLRAVFWTFLGSRVWS